MLFVPLLHEPLVAAGIHFCHAAGRIFRARLCHGFSEVNGADPIAVPSNPTCIPLVSL
jgi:hypothetical protein